MKRLIAVLLVLTVAFAMFGCVMPVDPDPDPVDPDPDPVDPDPDPVDPDPVDPNPDDAVGFDEYGAPDEPVFEVDSRTLDSMYEVADAYLAIAADFTSSDDLSDEAKFLAAVYSYANGFEPYSDNEHYYAPLVSIEAEVRRLFGEDASLSPDYKTKDYSPYEIDAAENIVKVLPQGFNESSYYFLFACIETDSGYELWVLDLEEDYALFSEDQLLDLTWDDIKDIEYYILHCVFTMKLGRDGEPYIAAYKQYYNPS